MRQINTRYVLPADQPWTVIEVTADNGGNPLGHFAFVFDGAGNLTVYRNKIADAVAPHTPSTDSFRIMQNLYDGTTHDGAYYAVTIDDTAFTQEQVDADYELYFEEIPAPGGLFWNGEQYQNVMVNGIQYDNVFIDGIQVIGGTTQELGVANALPETQPIGGNNGD